MKEYNSFSTSRDKSSAENHNSNDVNQNRVHLQVQDITKKNEEIDPDPHHKSEEGISEYIYVNNSISSFL